MLVFDLFLTGMVLTSISSRMVNPGVFRGSQKDFLLGEKAAYVAGVQRGYVHNALVDIQRKYPLLVFLTARSCHLRASHL